MPSASAGAGAAAVPPPQSSRHCRSRAPGSARTPGCPRARRAPRRRRAAGCWPTRRRRCRRFARQYQRAASNSRSSSVSTTTRWKLAQMSAISGVGSGASAARPSASRRVGHVAQHGRLQAAEAEIAAAGQMRRVAIGVRQPRLGKRHRAIVALRRRADRSPARPDIRDRAASPPCRTPPPPHRRACGRAARTTPGSRNAVQARVAARHDEHDRRQRQLAVLEHERLDVPGQVMHGDERHRSRPGERLARTTRRRAATRRGRVPA